MILLAGPEKAGKSTLADALRSNYGYTVKHWGPIDHDSDFLKQLQNDSQPSNHTVWDRGWPCEYVYSTLLHRDRRANGNAWLMEWLYGRALQTAGVGAIVLGPSAERLRELRDDTDLPVDPADEQVAYHHYGRRFSWPILYNDHTPLDLEALTERLSGFDLIRSTWLRALPDYRPPLYCGPVGAPVAFVGESLNASSVYKGSWLPFTTKYTARYGEVLGDDAFKCGWMNIDGPEGALKLARLVVACGAAAYEFCASVVPEDKILRVPHPAWLYRWGRGEENRGRVEDAIKDNVQRVLEYERGTVDNANRQDSRAIPR